MSKEYGHTKTLFLQNGKYYKWSYKHKGRGLCTSCWDKQRDKNPNRKKIKARAGKKWHETNYVHVVEPKKRVRNFTKEMEEAYKKQWYLENRPYLLLKGKIQRRLARGLPCMKIIVKGETKYLPFESLEKPKTITDKSYNEWKKNYDDYNILLKYYQKGTKTP